MFLQLKDSLTFHRLVKPNGVCQSKKRHAHKAKSRARKGDVVVSCIQQQVKSHILNVSPTQK